MAKGSQIDFDDPGPKVISPSFLAHVVLRTAKLQEMEDFYVTFLGGRVSHRNGDLSFITYDEEDHRIALFGFPGTEPKPPNSAGLHHISFTYSNMSDLLLAYRQRKVRGVLNSGAVNHGPTTSIYYRDPDGNLLEAQVENFDTAEQADNFISSEAFKKNTFGTEADPEQLIKRLKNGESDADLKRQVEIEGFNPQEMIARI